MKNSVYYFPVLALFAIVLAGCGPKCPQCSGPGSYSECNDEAVKTRTAQRCSEATAFQCESFDEETKCATEIKLSGNIEGVIKPSVEEKVKGVIKLEMTKVPEDTVLVAYFLEGGDLTPVGEGRRPLFAADQGDVWTGMLDTTEYENGLYTFGVISNNVEDMSGNPKAYAQGQILIAN